MECPRLIRPKQSRVANVVADHNDLLTQWRPIKMTKFHANIFLVRTTSGPRKFSKIRGLKGNYFHFPSTKNIPNWQHELIFMQLSFFFNKNVVCKYHNNNNTNNNFRNSSPLCSLMKNKCHLNSYLKVSNFRPSILLFQKQKSIR